MTEGARQVTRKTGTHPHAAGRLSLCLTIVRKTAIAAPAPFHRPHGPLQHPQHAPAHRDGHAPGPPFSGLRQRAISLRDAKGGILLPVRGLRFAGQGESLAGTAGLAGTRRSRAAVRLCPALPGQPSLDPGYRHLDGWLHPFQHGPGGSHWAAGRAPQGSPDPARIMGRVPRRLLRNWAGGSRPAWGLSQAWRAGIDHRIDAGGMP